MMRHQCGANGSRGVAPPQKKRERRNAAVAARSNVMRRTFGLLAILVLVAALAAPVAAQQRYYAQNVTSADSGVYRYLISNNALSVKGGISVPCINMSASANVQYSLVGYDSTPITVVTRVRKDAVTRSAVTVADSLHSSVLDTLPLSGAATTQYDTSKIASFKLRLLKAAIQSK